MGSVEDERRGQTRIGNAVNKETKLRARPAAIALTPAGALELVIARNSPSDPPTDLWLSVLLLAVLVAPIFARRRFPFGGPAAYWVLAAAITFYDGELIPFIGSLGVVDFAADDRGRRFSQPQFRGESTGQVIDLFEDALPLPFDEEA